jgi:thioredoxin reductase
VDTGRGDQPFTVHVTTADGAEERLDARAVIDASGTWRQPSPAGADGLPALGEHAAADFLSYQIPAASQEEALAGQHVVVVGGGHSALTAIIGLARIARDRPGTRVTWALRCAVASRTFGGGTADQLPERGALGIRAREAVDAGLVTMVTGFRVEQVRCAVGGAVLVAEDGRALPAAARVLVLAGFRPDLSFLSEMRLELDATLQAPPRVAAEIDPNVHACGDVAATRAATWRTPSRTCTWSA